MTHAGLDALFVALRCALGLCSVLLCVCLAHLVSYNSFIRLMVLLKYLFYKMENLRFKGTTPMISRDRLQNRLVRSRARITNSDINSS